MDDNLCSHSLLERPIEPGADGQVLCLDCNRLIQCPHRGAILDHGTELDPDDVQFATVLDVGKFGIRCSLCNRSVPKL
jgi:hypothetical protein